MNQREYLKKYLPVIEAFANGETIQTRRFGCESWWDVENPEFDGDHEFRIKPKSKTITVPYTPEEFMEEFMEKGIAFRRGSEDIIWVVDNCRWVFDLPASSVYGYPLAIKPSSRYMITLHRWGIDMPPKTIDLVQLMEDYVWEKDGTVCGKIVEQND